MKTQQHSGLRSAATQWLFSPAHACVLIARGFVEICRCGAKLIAAAAQHASGIRESYTRQSAESGHRGRGPGSLMARLRRPDLRGGAPRAHIGGGGPALNTTSTASPKGARVTAVGWARTAAVGGPP